MTKKKATIKKKKSAKNFHVLYKYNRRYGSSELSYYGAYHTEKAALAAITKFAQNEGQIGDYILTKTYAKIGVSLKIEALNKKVKK